MQHVCFDRRTRWTEECGTLVQRQQLNSSAHDCDRWLRCSDPRGTEANCPLVSATRLLLLPCCCFYFKRREEKGRRDVISLSLPPFVLCFSDAALDIQMTRERRHSCGERETVVSFEDALEIRRSILASWVGESSDELQTARQYFDHAWRCHCCCMDGSVTGYRDVRSVQGVKEPSSERTSRWDHRRLRRRSSRLR